MSPFPFELAHPALPQAPSGSSACVSSGRSRATLAEAFRVVVLVLVFIVPVRPQAPHGHAVRWGEGFRGMVAVGVVVRVDYAKAKKNYQILD